MWFVVAGYWVGWGFCFVLKPRPKRRRFDQEIYKKISWAKTTSFCPQNLKQKHKKHARLTNQQVPYYMS